jgi:sodium transport system permease protein
MRHLWIVFKKEMRYTLRDRRTLMVMVVIPTLVFPAIFMITNAVQKSAMEGEVGRRLKVAYLDQGEDDRMLNLFQADTSMKVIVFPDTSGFRAGVRADSFDLALAAGGKIGHQMDFSSSTDVRVWYDVTEELVFERGKLKIDLLSKVMMGERLDSLKLSPSFVEPLKVVQVNTSSMQETIGKMAGGFLPYIFIAFCYMGCMFPAIDLFTGEKERGTIETLLATPVPRWQLLAGKMLVVICSGFTTAILAFLGLFVGMKLGDTLPAPMMEVVLGILSPGFVVTFLLMLLPLVTAFAGLTIPATVYAKSFKEAQSILTPLNFVVITPAIVGMMPGIELNWVTALIPVLNVVLATKDLIAGTLDPLLFGLLMLSLLGVAVVAVLLSFKRFGSERNILRS